MSPVIVAGNPVYADSMVLFALHACHTCQSCQCRNRLGNKTRLKELFALHTCDPCWITLLFIRFRGSLCVYIPTNIPCPMTSGNPSVQKTNKQKQQKTINIKLQIHYRIPFPSGAHRSKKNFFKYIT